MSTRTLRKKLENSTRAELIVISRKLGITGYSALNKEKLVKAILSVDLKKLKNTIDLSWWEKHHNHVYGMVTIIALIVTILFNLKPGSILASNEGEMKPEENIPLEGGTITIGGKHFIESSILLEMIAITIEENTEPPIKVIREHNLMESTYCRDDLQRGVINAYPEYTGTLLAMHLNLDLDICREVNNHKEDIVQAFLNSDPNEMDKLAWIGPFGFHNGYSLVMAKERVKELGLNPSNITISDIEEKSPRLLIACDPEAAHRKDCLGGINSVYNLSFKDYLEDRRHDYLYQKLLPKEKRKFGFEEPKVDVIVGFTTDTQLLDTTYVQLRDEKSFFIKYYVGTLIQKGILEKFEKNGLKEALQSLTNSFSQDEKIADNQMRELIDLVESVKNENGEQLIQMNELKNDKNPKALEQLRKIVRNWLQENEVVQPKPSLQ